MKIKGLNEQRPERQKKKGVALLTVLTVMSLATILVLTFFTMAQSELESATSYSHGMEARHLSETAVNMVIGQIRKATLGQDPNDPSTRYAWASQPGAIRQYAVDGTMNMGFKLYSDDRMVEESEANLVGSDVAELKTWSSNPAVFVDLNQPVIRGKKVFYPIVDPRAKTVQQIDGFDYDTGSVGKSPLAGAVKKADSQADSLPMPVKWLYQLEDGSMGYMTGGGNKGTYKPVGGGSMPTLQNPIVGRVAFWADDETSKLNVNTAAGGMVWDTPRASGDIDLDFGRYQPAQHEWQRYPGHPAGTALAPVFFPGPDNARMIRDRKPMALIYALTPRVVGGGSRAGSMKSREPNGLVPDKDRLYPSLDEFILRPDRTENDFPASFMKGGVAQLLERARFFLTATSRAPEVTLFNTPRISIWPTYNKQNKSDEDYTTPFDNLIRFAAEVGEDNPGGLYDQRYIYHFQREDADSTQNDYIKITRNQELYEYLDELMETPIPGFGGSFRDKYGNENQNQLLTQIFDYIRSTNLFDDTVNITESNPEGWKESFRPDNKNDHKTYTNYRQADQNSRGMHMGHGQVAPIKINYQGVDTKGFGRFYTVAEVAFMVICNADPLDGTGSWTNRLLDAGVTTAIEQGDNLKEYSNFPPLTHLDMSKKGTWPNWLLQMEQNDKAKYQKAINPRNWNYMLLSAMQPTSSAPLYYPGDPFPKANEKAKFEEMRLKYDPNGRHEKLVQVAMLIRLFSPSQGWVPISPDMLIEIDTGGMFFGPGSTNVTFHHTSPSSYKSVRANSEYVGNPFMVSTEGRWQGWITNRLNFANVWGGLHAGGEGGFRSLMQGTRYPWGRANEPAWNPSGDFTKNKLGREPARYEPFGYKNPDLQNLGQNNSNRKTLYPASGRRAPFDVGVRRGKIGAENIYPWITPPFKVDQGTGPTPLAVPVKWGQQFKIRIYAHRNGNNLTQASTADQDRNSAPQGNAAPDLVQEITVHPKGAGLPMPELVRTGSKQHTNEFGDVYAPETTPMEWWSLSFDGAQALAPQNSNPRTAEYLARTGRLQRVSRVISRSTPLAHNMNHEGRDEWLVGGHGNFVRPEDTIWSYGVEHGDTRLIAALSEPKSNQIFKKHPKAVGDTRRAHTLVSGSGWRFSFAADDKATEDVDSHDIHNILPDITYGGRRPTPLPDKSATWQLYGDFDNGVGNFADGPYINKADEGNTHSLNRPAPGSIPKTSYSFRRDYGDYPYFVRDWVHEPGGASYFSPNRIMPSPGMFGSLPTAALDTNKGTGLNKGAWQTLLFRPDIDGNGYAPHPGALSPKDHLIMDLFWMPVVEPYAISETLSTAGKINMNYQILPFSYIKRSTGLHGVFKSEIMLTIPNKWADSYSSGSGRGAGYHWKYNPYGGKLQQKSLRSLIVADKTLEQFETEKFDKNEIFKSATEICDIFLIPEGSDLVWKGKDKIETYTPKVAQMKNGQYTKDHQAVGDNARERPYADIYPRLTTKSNTFKVHFRAQVIRKGKGRDPATWDPEYDQSVAEYRGSTVVERYIDPNDTDIPDYATNVNATSIDQFYRYRVLNTRRFSP